MSGVSLIAEDADSQSAGISLSDIKTRLDNIDMRLEALTDLLKTGIPITSETFVMSFENIVNFGLRDVISREKNLIEIFQKNSPQTKL